MYTHLVDSHCHLTYEGITERLDDVLEKARLNNVGTLLTISTRMSEWDKILKLAESHDHIYCTIGVHPHNADDDNANLREEDLLKIANHPKVIGLGETGLDFYYEHSKREVQEDSFRKHIHVAQKTGLPIIVHTRAADEDTIRILIEEKQKADFSAVIHCFSSSEWLGQEALKMGFYISLSGILTFKKSTELQEMVQHFPLDKLLVETDAPFLAPVPFRGKVNEPAFVKHTAEYLAKLLNLNYEDIVHKTTENFYSLFKKAKILKTFE